MNLFKPKQLLPKDILANAKTFTESEAERHVLLNITNQVTNEAKATKIQSTFMNWKDGINLVSGDSIEFTWKGDGKAFFHATGSGTFYTHQIK